MAFSISLLPGSMPVVDTTDNTRISEMKVVFTAPTSVELPSGATTVANYFVFNEATPTTRIAVNTAAAYTPTPALPDTEAAYTLTFAAGTGPSAANTFSLYFKNSSATSNELFIDNQKNLAINSVANIPLKFDTAGNYTVNTSSIDANPFKVTDAATFTVHEGPSAASTLTVTTPAKDLILWGGTVTVNLAFTPQGDLPAGDYSLALTSDPADAPNTIAK